MGIVRGGNTLYLNVSCGRFVNKKKEISAYAYEGTIANIRREEDEYEGKPVSKIKLTFHDSTGETAIISFSEESWYAQTFFARIEKADLSKPIVLGCSNSEQNEKMSFCWMKQGGQTIKKDEDFPKPAKKKVGRNEVTDWSPVIAEIDRILDGLTKKLNHEEGDGLPF